MTQGRQLEKKNLPPGKRTKTGKAPGQRKNRQIDGKPPLKKRPPTPLLVAWVLAVIFLVSLIYFAKESRRLTEAPADLPTVTATKTPKTPTEATGAPAGPANPKREPARDMAPVAEPSHQKSEISSIPDDPAELPHRRDSPPLAVAPKLPPESRAGNSPDNSPRLAKVSIVIDDFGLDLGVARQFASLPFTVTLSVLPHLAHSREIAEMAHKEGKEVILHLPMEPLSSKEKPGPGALLLSMSGDEIRRKIRSALDSSPYFDGVNNHMGSRMTRDAQAMKTVLTEIKGRDLIFIDSMTTNESKGWKVARELNIPSLKRDIFLDDDPSEDAIRSQIARLVKIAKIRGVALAIGHPHKTTLQSLQGAAAHFREEGIEIVAAHDLIK